MATATARKPSAELALSVTEPGTMRASPSVWVSQPMSTTTAMKPTIRLQMAASRGTPTWVVSLAQPTARGIAIVVVLRAGRRRAHPADGSWLHGRRAVEGVNHHAGEVRQR